MQTLTLFVWLGFDVTGVACGAGLLKEQQTVSKELVRMAKRTKAKFAETCQQEQCLKEDRQQELALLKDATEPAGNAALPASIFASTTTEAVHTQLPQKTVSTTASRPAAVVSKVTLEVKADYDVDSPRIAAVMPAMPGSTFAAADMEAVPQKAGAAAALHTGAADEVAFISSAGGAASWSMDVSHVALVQQPVAGASKSETIPGTTQPVAVLLNQTEHMKVDQEVVAEQQVAGVAEQEVRDGGYVGQQEAASTSVSVLDQVGPLCSL